MIIVENRKDFLYNLPKAENVDGKNPLGIYDANTLSYINGGQPISESSEKKTEEKSSADRMSVLLNEKLRKNPHDVQTWLAFVNIQDINSFQTVEENSSNKLENHKEKTSCRALMERKVSILDKAIENNPQSIQLIATRLDIASHYWSPPAMEQEWKNALFLNPVSHDLLYFSFFSLICLLLIILFHFYKFRILKSYGKSILRLLKDTLNLSAFLMYSKVSVSIYLYFTVYSICA